MYLKDFQEIDTKRVKERLVEQAHEKVIQWRRIFLEGLVDEQGQLHHYSLTEAANFVGIPKKTLEDYTQIFQKIKLVANLEEFMGKKMGHLRHYLKKNRSKVRKALYNERLQQQKKKLEIKAEKANEIQENSSNTCQDHEETDAFSSKHLELDYFSNSEEQFNDEIEESRVYIPYRQQSHQY